jgi:hypothetical protein
MEELLLSLLPMNNELINNLDADIIFDLDSKFVNEVESIGRQ